MSGGAPPDAVALELEAADEGAAERER
jgi:hypothetical protein